jgi:hypothetical protein
MLRSRMIIASSLALLLVVVIAIVVMSGDDKGAVPAEIQNSEQSESAAAGTTSSESADQAAAPGSAGAVVGKGTKGDPASATLGAAGASGIAAGAGSAAGAKSEVSETAAKKSDAPCQVVDLKSDVKETKGYLHEFRLARTLAQSEPLCVMVEGKSVGYTRMKDGRVRIDWRIARSSSKVSAVFCTEGVKCQVSCPDPEKDFWDSIGSDGGGSVGAGFADAETAEDKELQKEIKALKDVLNRKPSEAPVANWTIVAQHDSSCK